MPTVGYVHITQNKLVPYIIQACSADAGKKRDF